MSIERFIPQLSILKVENLRLRAYIGFMEWEREKLQDLVISYSFKYDSNEASRRDDVTYAVNYKDLTKEIIELVDEQSFQLIEHLAEQIYTLILSFSVQIEAIEVKVEKPHALRFTDTVMAQILGSDRYNRAMITLGSNIEAEVNVEKALTALRELGVVSHQTNFIETQALKFTPQADFLNGAITLLTKKSLTELRLALRTIEQQLGRVRGRNKNAPREIDLDVTTFNGFLLEEREEFEALPFLKDFLAELEPILYREIN